MCLWSVLLVVPANAQAPERRFSQGVVGAQSPDTLDRASTFFRRPAIRSLLARLESGSLPASAVDSALTGSGIALSQLLHARILRETNGRYAIGFSYFTLDDVRRIRAAADRHVPALVNAFLAHRRDFERIFASYPVASVDRGRLATVLLAGFALNWDGLTLTRELGYRRPEFVTGANWHYAFWAAEVDPEYSTRGFIWGSSSIFTAGANFPVKPVDFVLSSFGDPFSSPRMNLPDVLSLPTAQMTPDVRDAVDHIGTVDETFIGRSFRGVLGFARARSLGPMLFALRQGARSARELRRVVRLEDRDQTEKLLELLVAMDYVRARPDGRYELATPVLDVADSAMVRDAIALHRQILVPWLEHTFPLLRSDLEGLTVIRQGMLLEACFTQIWHDLFGLATRELVRAGMIADPYSRGVRHPGSLAVVWRSRVFAWSPG